jgi:hypothetical protein
MIAKDPKSNFYRELEALLNRYSVDSYTNTPDFILTETVIDSLNQLAELMGKRDAWHCSGISRTAVAPIDEPFGHVEEGPHPLPNLDDIPRFR